MAPFNLDILSDSMKSDYDQFIDRTGHAMMYHGWQYKEFMKSLLCCSENYLIARTGTGDICGVVPVLVKDGPLGEVWNSLPFYGSNGGILTDNDECFKFLVNAYNQIISNNTRIAAATMISNPLRPGDDYGLILRNYEDYRIGQFTSLDFANNPEEQLMTSYHYKTRNMVRKAIKEGVTVTEDNQAVDFLYETHQSNMLAIGGKPKPKAYYDAFKEFYIAGKDYKILLARIDGKNIAAMLIYYFNKTVEYYTPVIVEAYRDKQPLSLLIYHAMTEAAKDGFKTWNWGGTWATQGGVYTFKKRWGTYDVNYYYYTFLKNKEVLEASKDELLIHYDNFYVIAFNHLKSS